MTTSFADAAYYTQNEFTIPPEVSPQRIEVHLARASRYVRGEVPGIDARIAAGDVDPDLVADIVCELVETAVNAPGGPGIASIQQGAGPYQETLTFANPRGDLYLTAKHRRLLAAGGQRRAFTVRPRGHGA